MPTPSVSVPKTSLAARCASRSTRAGIRKQPAVQADAARRSAACPAEGLLKRVRAGALMRFLSSLLVTSMLVAFCASSAADRCVKQTT